MSSVFDLGKRSEGEILDLTAPALAGEGIVARWLRDSIARTRESLADPVPPSDEP
jgi:hypothetical protein